MFDALITTNYLVEVNIDHKTYHHFTGDGHSDSCLDKIIHSAGVSHAEVLNHILCSKIEPRIDSHHDLLFSTWIVPALVNVDVNSSLNIRAPKSDNSRHKIIWSDQGIQKYQETIVPHLSRLQILWLSTSPTKSSMQLLLQATNEALTTCARSSNHTIDLSLQITQ